MHKWYLGRIEDSLFCWMIGCLFLGTLVSCPSMFHLCEALKKANFPDVRISLTLSNSVINGKITLYILFALPHTSSISCRCQSKALPWSSPEWQSPVCIITNSRRLLRKKWLLDECCWYARELHSRAHQTYVTDVTSRFWWLFCCFSESVSLPANSSICCMLLKCYIGLICVKSQMCFNAQRSIWFV